MYVDPDRITQRREPGTYPFSLLASNPQKNFVLIVGNSLSDVSLLSWPVVVSLVFLGLSFYGAT